MSRVAVVRFPGSNCETETLAAVARARGHGMLVDYRATDLQGADAVILPGGFSYGDYLRSGAIARFAPVMVAVKALADAGGAVIGICNGFQILCEAHLLPGALQHNAQQRPRRGRWTFASSAPTPSAPATTPRARSSAFRSRTARDGTLPTPPRSTPSSGIIA